MKERERGERLKGNILGFHTIQKRFLEPMSPVKMSESLRDLLTLVSSLHSDNGWELVPLDN